jgi:pilus assembly protein Flp/PilA
VELTRGRYAARRLPNAVWKWAESRVTLTRCEVSVTNLINRVLTLMRDDSGQDLLEYGLLAALIALVAIVAVTNSGKAVNSLFSTIATQVQNAANAAGA